MAHLIATIRHYSYIQYGHDAFCFNTPVVTVVVTLVSESFRIGPESLKRFVQDRSARKTNKGAASFERTRTTEAEKECKERPSTLPFHLWHIQCLVLWKNVQGADWAHK